MSTKLNLDTILSSINSITDIPSVNYIGVTGGEPFLYPDDVLAIAECCKKVGRRFAFSTNAFWCENYSDTLKTMLQLKKCDTAMCFVSVDAFHQEYVSIERVKTLLSICGKLSIPAKLQTNSTKSTFTKTEKIVKDLQNDKLYSTILFAAAYPIGAAKENLCQDDFFTRKLENARCQYQGQLYISSDGIIQPCCSPCVAGIDFNFGNIYTDSLKEAIKAINENKMMCIIINEGFSAYLKVAAEELGFSRLDEYVDSCHLCNHLLANSERYYYLQKKAQVGNSL